MIAEGIEPFPELKTERYREGDTMIEQRQFPVQDPDGYLPRFTD